MRRHTDLSLKTPKCFRCEERPSDLHCQQCAKDFCYRCFKVRHKKPSKRNHVKEWSRYLRLDSRQSKPGHSRGAVPTSAGLARVDTPLRLPKIKHRPRSAPLHRRLRVDQTTGTPRTHNAEVIDNKRIQEHRVSLRRGRPRRLARGDMSNASPARSRSHARPRGGMVTPISSRPISARAARRDGLVPSGGRLPPLPRATPEVRSPIESPAVLRARPRRPRLRLALNGISASPSGQSGVLESTTPSDESPRSARSRLGMKLGLKLRPKRSNTVTSAGTDTDADASSPSESTRPRSGRNPLGLRIDSARRESAAVSSAAVSSDSPASGDTGAGPNSLESPVQVARARRGLKLPGAPVQKRSSIEDLGATLSAATLQASLSTALNGTLGASLNASFNASMRASMERARLSDKRGTWEIKGDEFHKGNFVIDLKGVRRKTGGVAKTPLDKTAEGFAQPRVTINPVDLVKMDQLGNGFSATVIKAVDRHSFQILALKRISVFDRQKRHMLIKELEAFELAEAEENPYIVEYHGAYFSAGATTLALEYMNQGSLEEVLKTFGPPCESVVASICKQALEGLKFLRSHHMIHRDIKPANILVNQKGQVKLADFGILGILPSSEELSRTCVGTKRYMSPERIKSEPYSYNSDIWSLGVVAIEMATGKFPINAKVGDGYFAIVTAICESPIAELDAKKFSEPFRKISALMVIRDPVKRPGAESLLLHEFVRQTDPVACASDWPFVKSDNSTESDLKLIKEQQQKRKKDLEEIAGIFVDKMIAKEEYKPTLANMACFQKIAEQLEFDAKVVRDYIEECIYKAKLDTTPTPRPPGDAKQDDAAGGTEKPAGAPQ